MRFWWASTLLLVTIAGCARGGDVERPRIDATVQLMDGGPPTDAMSSSDGALPPDAACPSTCLGRECGDDGCGGSCGTCTTGSCMAGSCVGSCSPDCAGRECGDDGCGGTCGTCTTGSCMAGRCVSSCTPNCAGRECGDDGCGGTCGTCTTGSCMAGSCVSGCTPNCAGRECGDDSCGGSCGTCGTACTNTCRYPSDGECDDGGPGSLTSLCAFGTDCVDCGPRTGSCVGGTCTGGSDPCGGACTSMCTNTCRYPSDGECDDGGLGSLTSLCGFGTDCADCGTRTGVCSGGTCVAP